MRGEDVPAEVVFRVGGVCETLLHRGGGLNPVNNETARNSLSVTGCLRFMRCEHRTVREFVCVLNGGHVRVSGGVHHRPFPAGKGGVLWSTPSIP